jgi:hypothetical protein
MKRELIAVMYGKYGGKEGGKFQRIWGAKFENMKTEGEIEPKKGSKTERKKKGTQDGGRIDRKNARNTRPNTKEPASA